MGCCNNSVAAAKPMAGVATIVADSLDGIDADMNFAGRGRGSLVDRRCDWPFVDAWTIAGDLDHREEPCAFAAACWNIADRREEPTMGVGRTMTLLPRLMVRLPNVGPD